MQYQILGQTGVHVSELCFGTMSFGDIADEEMSARMFHRCREAGINFFDCANTYAGGRSEEILGKLIKSERDKIVLTTKVCSPVGDHGNDRGLSRRHLRMQVENSLRRLDTDRIDLYFVHHFDPYTPIPEVMRGLDSLVRDGKILYLGVSNWAAWQIALSLGASAQEGLARFECIQPMYSLIKRQAEVEILPLAQHQGMGVIPYSPMGGGLLSGKYTFEERPPESRLAVNTMYQARYADAAYFEIASQFAQFAQKLGVTPATLAVAWVLQHPGVTAPIIGARNTDQLEPSLQATELAMDGQLWEEVSDLSYQPAMATDREDDRNK